MATETPLSPKEQQEFWKLVGGKQPPADPKPAKSPKTSKKEPSNGST